MNRPVDEGCSTAESGSHVLVDGYCGPPETRVGSRLEFASGLGRTIAPDAIYGDGGRIVCLSSVFLA